MKRNYNGTINFTLIGDLRRLCKINEENRENLSKMLEECGEGRFYTNLDPFTGCPDEMSDINTLKSEEEIAEYLKKDLDERIKQWKKHRRIKDDILLNILIDFVKEHAYYPEGEELHKLEKAAESARLATLSDEEAKEQISEEKLLILEVLQLAEEIMETRRIKNPDDIRIPVEPYPECLTISNGDFRASIQHQAYYGSHNSTDYSVFMGPISNTHIFKIYFCYDYDGSATVESTSWGDIELDISNIIDQLIDAHKNIVEIAKKEGLQFTPEVDYKKLSAFATA